jgi:hypothetical protein
MFKQEGVTFVPRDPVGMHSLFFTLRSNNLRQATPDVSLILYGV